MPTRRHLLTGIAALAGWAAAPALAQATRDPNPVPPVIRKALEQDPNAPAIGAARPTAVMVEFFDYNCPHCRAGLPTVARLLRTDTGLQLVLREWPVFGAGSVYAARAALASRTQGKYWAFHTALLQMKDRAEEATVLRTARRVGLDEARLRADMDTQPVSDHIAQSEMMASHFGLIGTPTFIIGSRSSFGRPVEAELRAMIADYRAI